MIQFEAAFGNEDKHVVLSSPSGGGSSYHIMVNRYYLGSVNKMLDGWKVYFNNPDEFTKDDEDAILERLGLL